MEQTRTRHRFTVDEYEAMGEAGILDDDRVELWDGEILEKPVVKPPHAACVNRLTMRLAPALAGRAIVAVQNAIKLPPSWEPEPDIALLAPRDDYYSAAHPGRDDILLLIEVADTTLLWDRNRKVPVYARTGIREVWLVDINARRVEVYLDPGPDGYATTLVVDAGQTLSPRAFPDLRVAVADILGRSENPDG